MPAAAGPLRRLRRLLAALVLVVLLVTALLVAALTWLAASSAGTRTLVGWLAPLAAPTVTVAAVEGALRGPLTLRGLTLTLPTVEVQVARLALRWRPRALWWGRFAVTALTLDGVQVTPLEADDATAPAALATPLLPPLPLAVSVDALAVNAVTLAGVPGRLGALTLAASLDGRQVRLDDIALAAVTGAGRQVVLAGEIGLADGATPVLAVTLGGRLDGTPPIVADLALAGALDSLRVDARVEGAGPAPLRLGGQLDLLAAVPRFELALEADALVLGDAPAGLRVGPSLLGLNGTPAAFDVALDTRLARADAAPRDVNLAAAVGTHDDGGGWHGTFTWQARAASGPWPVLAGDGRFDYADDTLTLAHHGDAPLTSELTATLSDLAATPRVSARLAVTDLAVPLPDAGPLHVAQAEARAEGPIDALAVTLGVRGQQARAGAFALDAAGELGTGRFTLAQLEAALLGGEIRASGALEFPQTPSGAFAFSASGLDLGRLRDGLDSALAFRGDATFALHEDGRRATLTLDELGGSWRGHVLDGRLGLAVDGTALTLRTAQLSLGDNRLEASAELGAALRGNFLLRAPDLGQLAPGFGGELRADGSLAGTRQAPRVRAELAGARLRGADWSVAALDGDVALDFASDAAQHVTLSLRDIEAARRALGTLVLDADGTLAEHRLRATLGGGAPTLRVVARGAWAAPTWQGDLLELELADTPLGTWALAAPAALTAGAAHVDLERTCLAQDAARLCVALDGWSGTAGAATLALEGLPLARFSDYLPTTIGVRGRLGGEARLTASTAGLDGTAALALDDATLSATRADGTQETVPLSGTRVTLALTPDALDAALVADLGAWLAIEGDLRYALSADRALAGRLAVNADELDWIEEFVPRLAGTHGALALTARVGGSVERPQVALATRLRDGAIVLPASGTRIAQLELTARTRDSRTLVIDGKLGDGEHA
ncbi:MAG: hypothetical protein RLW62_07925, partial [Gammaproteobacteria bacterium]